MNLYSKYSNNPYDLNKIQLDSLINSCEYVNFYKIFEKFIQKINSELDKNFFKGNFNYASKNFITIEPHIISFSLFIKSLILEKIISIENKFKIQIYNEELNKNVLSKKDILSYRFLNQYALLIQSIGSPFEVEYVGRSNVKYQNDPRVKNKFSNIFNFKIDFLMYEIKKRVLRKSRKNKILKFGQNYLTREIESELYNCGIGVSPCKEEVQKFYNQIKLNNKFSSFESINKIILKESKMITRFYKNERVFNSFLNVLSHIANNSLINLFSRKELMRSKFSILKNKIKYKICLSNGLFGLFGKSVYDAMNYNGIKVVSAEHGITWGISKDSIPYFNANETLTSDILFCYSNGAKKTHMSNENSNLKVKVVGAPYFPKYVKFGRIKHFFHKKRLAISGTSIFYVSHNIELNSAKYFPFTKANYEIFNDELFILKSLGQVNKNIVYKPYPTKQYLYNRTKVVRSILKKYKNISFFKGEEDFRYVRYAANIIVTNSSESTLEWCIGADVPLVFLDSDYYEPLINNEVKKAFKESFFVFNYDKKDWEKEFISFLNLPYNEILNKWKKKEIYRKKYDDLYFLSKNKDAGKIGSTEILNLIND